MEGARGSGAKHIIFVHGACHGGWSWYKVASRLRSGVPTFRDYTGPLLDVLRSLPEGEKAVLVGHSLGGLSVVALEPVTLAAELFPEKVAAAVFLTAFMPDCMSPPSVVILKNAERSPYTPLDNEMKPQDADGKLPSSFMFGPKFTEQKLYQLCSPEDLTLGKSLMRIGSLFVEDLQIQLPFTKERYGSVPKVYVVCKQDETISEEHQRWMVANNPVDEVMEIDGADHMAMLSAPDQVVECIIDITKRYN
ncbi:unnamed protein product [Alopecurus aequalis]